MYIAMAGMRFKYYTAWYFCDGSIAMSGLSYNGQDENKNPKWDRIISVGGFGIELGTNARNMIDLWNHQTAVWLRHYVFTRVKTAYPKTNFRATMATFMVSAFWHGFYPVYYTFFFFAALLAEATKDMYRARYFFTWMPAPLKAIFCHFGSMLALDFMGISFKLLTMERAFRFYGTLYYYVPICLVLVIVLLR